MAWLRDIHWFVCMLVIRNNNHREKSKSTRLESRIRTSIEDEHFIFRSNKQLIFVQFTIYDIYDFKKYFQKGRSSEIIF